MLCYIINKMSNRTKIQSLYVERLKLINGGVSTFDSSYTYLSNVHENVYKGLKFIDEINDFPSIYVTANRELRRYHTQNLTEAVVSVVLRCYVYGDNPKELTNNMVQDIEHIIYNMTAPSDLLLQDTTIQNIIIDKGLLKPYGIAEVFLTSRFEILT